MSLLRLRTVSPFVHVAALALAVAGCSGDQFTSAGADDAEAGKGQDNVTDASAGDGPETMADADAEAGEGPDAAVSDVQACGDRARQNCLEIADCSPEVLATTYGSETACETRLKLNCLDSLATASNGNSAESTEACAQAFAALSCTDYFDLNPAPACLQAKGSLANGQVCGVAGQCQTGVCAIAPGNACGTCAPVPQVGDSCALASCGQTLTCVSTTKLCAAFAIQGSACNAGQPCGAGLSCVGTTTTASGTCQPAVEEAGAPCDPTLKAGPACDRLASLVCNSVSKQCAALVFAAAGQACGSNVNNQFAVCANAATCVPTGADSGSDASAAETCLPAAEDGAPCDLVNGPFCLDPARCILTNDAGTSTSGTCQFPNPLACQ